MNYGIDAYPRLKYPRLTWIDDTVIVVRWIEAGGLRGHCIALDTVRL